MSYRQKKILKSFRLNKADLKKLKQISEEQGVSQNAFLESALHRMFWDLEQRKKTA